MDNRFNTIAGWALAAGIVALGAAIVTSEIFNAERPEKMGYPIEGVEVADKSGAAAEQPIATYLASADAAAGEQVFKKCAACHTVNQGGANGLGPNLYGVVGKSVAHLGAAFAYSDALKSHGGTWDWESLNQWLKSPKTFAPGTKMTFAGLAKPEDRANLLAYMNSQGSNIALPPPPPPVATESPADAASAADSAASAVSADSAKKVEGK